MALNPATFSAAIIASAPFPGGPSLPLMALAIANAFTIWAPIPANVLLTGVTSGTAGVGTVLGSLICAPNPLLVQGILSSFGVIGPTSPLLSTAIGIGIPTALATVQYTGVSAGVSAGADISAVTFSNPATLAALILANFPTPGVLTPLLSFAIATSITTLLTTSVGIGVVVPVAPAPSPAVGASISTLF
jgi:hypothetical protein